MIEPQAVQGQPIWKLGTPRQTQIPDPGRGFIAGWEIPVIFADKSSFTITVAATDFTPDKVQALIDEHVSNYLAIRSLEGQSF
jgi:hypothetical protein